MKNLIDMLKESLRIGINDKPEDIKIWNCKGECFEIENTTWYVYLDVYNRCYKVNAFLDLFYMTGAPESCDDYEDFGPEDILFQSDDLKECIEFILEKTCNKPDLIKRIMADIRAGKYKHITDQNDWKNVLSKYDIEFERFYSYTWALSVLNDTISEEESLSFYGDVEAKDLDLDTYEDAIKTYNDIFDSGSWTNKAV